MNLIQETEKNFANFVGCKHCILVTNGTAALHASYLVCNLEYEAVIVPSYTYYATSNMLLACNAIPVFADINPKTYLIDIKDALRKRPSECSTIVVVNLFGKELPKKDIEMLKQQFCHVIIDSAQCVKSGVNYGDIQTFSFYKTKNISTFEGGAICTNNDKLAKQLRIICNQGEDGKYNTVRLGFNFRMSEPTALWLNHQIMYHQKWGESELGKWGPKDGHYPRVVYEQPLYKDLGLYYKWRGKCPNAEALAKKVREGKFK